MVSRSRRWLETTALATLESELYNIYISLKFTRSFWTFVTNQRRILGDNATENSRSEAQLLAVKIRRGCFAVVVKRDTTK
jgi:hypothetical protein